MLLVKSYKRSFFGEWKLEKTTTWINPKAICYIEELKNCSFEGRRVSLYRLSFPDAYEAFVDAEDFQDILLASDSDGPSDDYFSSRRRGK